MLLCVAVHFSATTRENVASPDVKKGNMSANSNLCIQYKKVERQTRKPRHATLQNSHILGALVDPLAFSKMLCNTCARVAVTCSTPSLHKCRYLSLNVVLGSSNLLGSCWRVQRPWIVGTDQVKHRFLSTTRRFAATSGTQK
jgi:hypothetical protein